MNILWYHYLCILGAYVLGSVSFAYLVGRWRGKDLRRHGSGNLGATNAARVLGSRWFAPVFTADLLKGLLPVALVAYVLPRPLPLAAVLVGMAAILGHIFTCFHAFRGGKAVATSVGVLLALDWRIALLAFAVWVLAWLAGRRLPGRGKGAAVGPASTVAAVSVPVFALLLPRGDGPWTSDQLPLTVLLFVLAAVVVVRHISNLKRFFAGDAAAYTATTGDDADPKAGEDK